MPMRKVLEKRRRINSFAERERADSETANILEKGATGQRVSRRSKARSASSDDFFFSLVVFCRSTTLVSQTELWISGLDNFRSCPFFLTPPMNTEFSALISGTTKVKAKTGVK